MDITNIMSENLSKEDEFLLSKKKEILASVETKNQFLDFLIEKFPKDTLKNFDDNIDMLQALERRTTLRLTVNNIPPNVSKVGMYLKLVCFLGMKSSGNVLE